MDPQKRHSYLSQFVYPAFTFKGGKAGRIEARSQKANLLILSMEGGDNVTVRADLELAPLINCAEILDVGDIVWISESGQELHLLAPAVQNRVKFNGHFDLARARQWQTFIERLREFFYRREFVEVRTPTLVTSPGLEPFLDPFKTEFQFGSKKSTFFLPTSPEFHLKKLLSRGWRKIFEFKECFRNGELSDHHQPEFLMLEWYRAFSDFEVLVQEVKELMLFLQERFAHKRLFDAVDTTTMRELFKSHLDFELTPQTTRDDLASLCEASKIHYTEEDSFDDLFARVFLEKIELQIGTIRPIIVKNFPPSQCALARLNSDGWADRFELYWKGFELANAFHELNDPREQRRRFVKFASEKKELKKEILPVDEDFLAALDYGMPPSVGIALGVERLFLAFIGENQMSSARAFPVAAPASQP
jgi:elongation factor P--(R)-beta-lysine ligase